jgi:hypothetical protein
MVRTTLGAVLALLTVLATRPAGADPIAVKYTEGITRGFPVLRALNGEKLAQGDLVQIRGGDVGRNSGSSPRYWSPTSLT